MYSPNYVIMGLASLSFLSLSLVCLWLVMYCLRTMATLLNQQESRMRDLTNLAASKDLTTFQALQHTKVSDPLGSNTLLGAINSLPDDGAMDDTSIARRMSNEYRLAGMDPNLAYDQATFTEEFGAGGDIV